MNERMVLIDLPALDLEDGVEIEKQPALNRKIHRSRALKKWHVARRVDREPSRDLSDYSDSLEDAGTAQIRGILAGFLERAQEGDLVVVAPRAYNNLVYIGEFTTPSGNFRKLTGTNFYSSDAMYGRPVKWLAKIEKRWLEDEIIQIIHKPNAFVQLPASSRKWFYDLAYQSYQVGEDFRGRFDVTSQEFQQDDDLMIQAFFKFVAVGTRLVAEKSATLPSIEQSIFLNAGIYRPALKVDVSSPGFLSLSAPKVTPLVASVLLALAVSLPAKDVVEAAEAGTLIISNSKAPSQDPCTAIVQTLSVNQLKLHGLDQWPKACEKAKEAHRRTGLTGPARLKP